MVDPDSEGLNERSWDSQRITSVMRKVIPKIFLETQAKFTFGFSGYIPTTSLVLVSSFTRAEFGPRSMSGHLQ